jgi:hypothetical protein
MILAAPCPQIPISLAAVAAATGTSANYLGLLIRQKKLHGIKRQRQWYTTRDEIARYQADVAAATMPRGRPKSQLLVLPIARNPAEG